MMEAWLRGPSKDCSCLHWAEQNPHADTKDQLQQLKEQQQQLRAKKELKMASNIRANEAERVDQIQSDRAAAIRNIADEKEQLLSDCRDKFFAAQSSWQADRDKLIAEADELRTSFAPWNLVPFVVRAFRCLRFPPMLHLSSSYKRS